MYGIVVGAAPGAVVVSQSWELKLPNPSDPPDCRERSTKEQFGRGQALGPKPRGGEEAPAGCAGIVC